MTSMQKIGALVAAAVLMAGCGGGGSDADSAAAALAQVPESASASSSGLVSYLKRLSQALDLGESAESLALTDFNPPTPEDAEPEAVE